MSLIHRTGTSLSHPRRRHVAALASGLLLAGGLVAAAAPATAAVPVRVLDVTAVDNCDTTGCAHAFELSSDHLTAGLIDVRLHNEGRSDHQVQFIRLHEGVSPTQYFDSLVDPNGGNPLALGDAMGGSNGITPGGFQETWVNLPAGTYVALCFLSDPGEPPHFVDHMFTSFTVSGQGNSAHPPGHVVGTISAFTHGSQLGFDMPSVIDGHGIYRFVNTAATDTHELTLLKIGDDPGAAAEALAWLANPNPQTPPPFSSAGGNGALAPGHQGWVRMNLKPGHYLAVCFVPDDEAPHLPHVELGMHHEFSVDG